MAELIGESKVYSEFLSNLGVAWFSAGVIAPLFTPITGLFRLSGSLIAVAACWISLKLAVLFAKGGK